MKGLPPRPWTKPAGADRFPPAGIREAETYPALFEGVPFVVKVLDRRPIVPIYISGAGFEASAPDRFVPRSERESEMAATCDAVVRRIVELLDGIPVVLNFGHRTYVRYNPSNPLSDCPKIRSEAPPERLRPSENPPLAKHQKHLTGAISKSMGPSYL